MKTNPIALTFLTVASLSVVACKGSPASPFNTLEGQPITVYRLQNFEAAPVASATPTPATQPGSIIPGLPAIPGLTPDIQNQIQGAQTMLCSMLPPGSPGCTPIGATPATPVPAVDQTPRFEGFRVLGQAQVMDESLREKIIDIFGYEDSFTSKKSPCQYPELGFSFGGGQPSNVLVSIGCNQAWAKNFGWPHPDNGLKEGTVKSLSEVVQQLFGGG